ncbi:MAG: pyridoxal phosphate-dependent aminotransferase [Desulfurococcales archaeon]|nr:pyridoxal phosphate-dependent aminotransferase [Desulfurococcales archaeon]
MSATTIYSRLSEQLEPEGAFVYLDLARQAMEKGIKVISFGIGQPDFVPPREFLDKVKEAIDKNFIRYISPLGLPELRAKIAEYLNNKYGADVKPEEVAVTVGAKAAVFMSIVLLTRMGDEVVVPDPGFPTYECVVRYAGGRPVFSILKEENEFRMVPDDIEKLLTKNTRGIIVNSPHNPTGSALDKDDVEGLMELARRRNLFIISDEIYEDYVYEGKHYSFLSFPDWRDHVIYISGLSKTWAVPGFRFGILVARKEVINKIELLATNIYSCPPAPFQYAALKAFEIGIEWFNEVREDYRKRRDTVLEELSKLPGVKAVKPRGAFYVFPNVKQLTNILGYKNVDELSRAMLFEAGVLMLPGTAFPLYGGEGFMRISYVLPVETIRKGFEKIRIWLESRLEGENK